MIRLHDTSKIRHEQIKYLESVKTEGFDWKPLCYQYTLIQFNYKSKISPLRAAAQNLQYIITSTFVLHDIIKQLFQATI